MRKIIQFVLAMLLASAIVVPSYAQVKTFVTYTPVAWSSSTTYAVNDMVTVGTGSGLVTYISLIPLNINNNPASTVGTDWNIVGTASGGGSGGNVTGTGLTSNHCILGSGASAIKVDPDCTSDGAGNYTTVSNTTGPSTSTSTVNKSTNYPLNPAIPGQGTAVYAANQNYFGSLQACSLTQLTPDLNEGQQSYCIGIPFDTVTYPGIDYGSPGYCPSSGDCPNSGWLVHTTIGGTQDPFTVNKFNAGILNVWNMPVFGTGPGDIIYNQIEAYVKPAWIAGSDEGVKFYRNIPVELAPWVGTVVSGGTGANQLELACTFGGSNPLFCETLGLNSPLIDYNSAQSGSMVSQTLAGIGNIVAATVTGFTVAVSTQATTTTEIIVPRTINNTTGQLSKATVTFSVSGLSGAVTGTPLVSFIDMSDAGGPFYEVARVTPGSYFSGTQSFTATLHYSHAASTHVCIGGAVGGYLELTNYTQGSGYLAERYLENVMCSTASNVIWVAHQAENGLQTGGAAAGGLVNGPVVMYQGGEIYGILDANGNPSNCPGNVPACVTIGDNNASWTTGDQVANPNNIAAAVSMLADQSTWNNPYMQRIADFTDWNGLGGANNPNYETWKQFGNPNASTNYLGSTNGSAVFTPPAGIVMFGSVSVGFGMQHNPMYTGAGVGFLTHCSGWVICLEGPDPNDASAPVMHMVDPDASVISSGILYNHSTETWSLDQDGTWSAANYASIATAHQAAQISFTPQVSVTPTVPAGSTTLAAPQTVTTANISLLPQAPYSGLSAKTLSGSTMQEAQATEAQLASAITCTSGCTIGSAGANSIGITVTSSSLTGTTGVITGTSLSATCDSGTATVTGATVGHTVGVSSTTGADVGGAFYLRASVTSTNTVTVYVCGTGTPASLAYNVTTY